MDKRTYNKHLCMAGAMLYNAKSRKGRYTKVERIDRRLAALSLTEEYIKKAKGILLTKRKELHP